MSLSVRNIESPPSASLQTSPSTALPDVHHKPLLSCIPLPSQLNRDIKPVNLHPMLSYHHVARVEFDLFDPHECIERLMRWGCALRGPATKPPLPSISLVIPSFPWPIVAHASSTWRGNPVVTVIDVLAALYKGLRLPANEDVIWEGLMGSKRARGIRSTAGTEIQRLEYLGGTRRFVGLSYSTLGGDTMNVHIERGGQDFIDQ